MKAPRALFVLTATNVAVAIATMALHLRPAFAEDPVPILRGRGLQIVDAQGRVCASISVLPAAGTTPDADEHAETVLLRLITERGRPTIKIGASEPASGMSVVGPTGMIH